MSGQEQEDSWSILGGEGLTTACWKEGLGDLSWVRWGPQSRPLLLFHTCEYQRRWEGLEQAGGSLTLLLRPQSTPPASLAVRVAGTPLLCGSVRDPDRGPWGHEQMGMK